MPTNFDLIRKRNNIPVKKTEKTNTISTQKEGPEITLVPKNKDGGIDWNAIRERNGMGETNSNSTEEERIQEKLDRVLSKDRQTNTPSLLEQTEGLSDYIQDFTQMRKEETGKAFGSVETYEPVSRQTPVGRLQNNMEENESQDAFSFTQPVQAFESAYTQQEAEQAIKNLSNINTLYEQIRKNTIEGGAYVPTTGSYSLTDEQRKEIEQATKELESIISSNTSSAIEKEAAQQYVNLFEEITGTGNYAKLALSQFAQGVPSTIRNTATGIPNMIWDFASGGRLSESTKKLDKYFSENPNLLQEIAQGKPVYTPAIAEETGVRQNDLDQYLATAQDRAMQERNYAEYGQNLNQGRAEFIGSNAYSLGAQIPGLLLTSGANSVSPMWKKTVEQAKELGYLIDAKTGNVLKNLKDVTGGLLGNLADGKSLKTALKSAFQGNFATYLIGVSASGGQYNELMRTEDYDVRNFLNAFGQGFAEYFTEGLFGFSDMASFERFFDSSIGNGTTRFLKGLLNWLSGGGEEGLEEIVNAPLGELINFATGKKEDMKNAVMSWNPEFSTGGFQGIRAIIGENGIFNLEDMMVGGLGGFVTGAILGMAGSVASTYDSMKEGKDISKTVKTLNRFAQEELPDVFRPQMLDPNTASRKDVAAYTVQIQNAIADYAGELKNQMEAAEMQAEADARRSVESSAAQAVLENNAENIPGMLPTAAQAEERARLRRDATELERSGIAAGVSDEDMQTARRLSNVLGREIRFYDGNNREGTEAVANGYYDRNTIYVNSRSRNPVAQIISHELTHSLESAKAYGELSNMILGELERTGEDLSRMRAEKKNLYARNGVMLSNENANREIVAEYVEKNLLSNETKILELTRKNRTLAQRISGWIQSTLAKLGNKKSQERVFLERANRLYAKALRQTQNETGQRMPQEAQSTMQNRAQEGTAAQPAEVQKYREPSRDAEQTVRRTEEPERYETGNAAPTERVNPEGMRELQEAYAAGQITDEEFDDAIDALMEEEGLLDRDMLDAQYSISLGGYTPDVQVSSDGILAYFGIDNLNRKYDVINKVAAKLPYLSTEQQRKPIVNIDTGLEIEIWKKGINETFGNDRYFALHSERYQKAKLAIMPQLAKLIKYGEVRAPERGNYHNAKSGVRYAYLSAPATVDGESYTVTMDIRRSPNGENRFYIHDLKLNKAVDTSSDSKKKWNLDPIDNERDRLRKRISTASNTTIPQQSTGVNPSIRESGEPDTSGGIMLPTASDSDIRYSISEDFAEEIDAWDGRSDKTFHVGTVSEALKSIGVKDNRIIWHSGKIVKILKKHHAMDRNTIKQVPQVLEHPIVVLKSQNTDSRIVMFGEIMDNAGKPITAVLELMPTSRDGRVLDLNVIASAYGKDHIKSFIGSSDLLYLDPNKKRTDTWLQGLGLQLPSDTTTYGPIGTITYHDGEVKISGVPYDQYMREDGEKYTPQYSVDENDENERATGYDDRGERWDGTMMEIGKDQTEREAEEARRIQNAEYQNYPWLYGTGETVSEAIQEGERTQTPGMLPKAEADPAENLPAKAKRYFTRAERYLIDKMARVLNVPNLAGRESFQTVVREIADEYLQNGTVSGETIARVFNQAYEDSVALNRAYYEEYRELREYFKTLNLTITKEQANDIPDQDAFLQSNRNRIGIRMGEDSNVNEVYAELQRKWPALFQRGSELTEAEKAQKIASAAQSFEMAKRSLNGYYGKNPNEARRWARRDFEAAVQDATGEFQVVRRYMEDRNAEKQEIQIPTTQEEVARLWVLAKTARKNYEKVLARNLLTEHDEIQVGRLLRGEIEPQHLNEAEDNVQGITAVYQAKREYEDIAKVIRAWNQARKAALKQQADGYLETANDWKDKQAGILYARETMERNIRDIVPDEDLADEIIRRYFTPVHDAAAQANRMKNQYRERVKALDLSRDIAEGNLVSEAHAVQLLGEAEDNIRMMTQSRGLIRERDGKTLEEWRGVVKKLWEENPNLDAGKIRSAVEDFRKIYDELFQMMNETRIRNGYEPVNYRNGYFPHFQPGDGDGILARFGKAMGVTTDVTALPTTINGLTHTFRPGIQWFGNAQERLGFNTVYDAVEGFDKYIEGVSDVIFQTDNIQRLRALATQIRYRTGDEGIRKQIDDVLTNPNLTEEEKQDRISRIYESGRYALSNFVAELDEYTNLLANKKSRSDRGMERAIGRRAYNVMKALEQRLGANMVAINPGSWLTNFIPLVQGNAMLDRGMLLRGMWDTLKAYRSDDGIVNQSSFLTNRRGSDPIVKSYEQGERAAGGAKKVGQTIGKAFGKSGEILASPMEFIDYFVADSLVRARYRQNLGKGMSEDAAMEDADAFAAGVMADRSKGAMPTLFYSRNPMVKLFTQFQLEVNNQISYILKDIPREKRKNAGRSITAMLLKFFLGSWLFNEIFEFTIGRRPTLDPIGILNDTAGDLTGWELPNLVELGLGAVSGNMPSFQTEQVGLYDAGINMFEDAAEQMPFIGGLLGGGRLPISSAIPDFSTAWNALTNDEWSSEKRWQEIRDEVLEKPVTYLALPFGGGQLKKIYEGIEGILEGGSYVVNAEGERQLQYPIYADTTGEAIGNAVRATLFGRTSLPTGQEWIESGFGMLSADQTAVYEGMLEAGISGREAYELIESMRQAEKTDTESKADQQRRILEESGISGEGKSIAYYGMLASDRERELMTSLNDDFTDMGEVTDVLLAIKDAGNLTGAAASNAKRDAILESGLSESDKKEIYRYTFGERQENGTYTSGRDEDIQAFENAGLSFDEFLEAQNEYSTINEQYDRAGDKALEFSRWVDEQPYTDKQKDVIKESFRYFTQVPTDAGRYETFQEAGLSTESAYELTEILNGLEPEEGKAQVSNYQRYTAILESSLGEREKLDAIGAIMGTEMETESGNPTQYARLLSAMDEGVNLKDWFGVTQYKSEAKTDYDEYGEEVKSAKEKVVEYIDSLNISEEEKDALYLYGCNYAESGLSDTPWQSGGWSMSDIDWSGIVLPMA